MLSLVMFLQCLNTSLITVPLPKIANDLGISVSDSSWLLLAYSLGTCALLLQFAKYSRNNRIRKFFLYGTGIFTLASFDCFLAQDFLTLTVLRFAQGVAIAMAAATGPVIVVNNLPDNVKGYALGSMAAGTGLAMVLGPSLGGILSEFVSWNALFLVNVPLGLLTLAIAWHILPAEDVPVDGRDPDVWGSIGFFVAVAFGLTVLENITTWDLAATGATGFVAVLGLALLVIRLSKKRRCDAVLTVEMVRERSFILIAVSAMMGSMITEGTLYLLPYFMQVSWNMGVTECGAYFCVVSVVTYVSAKAIGRYCDSHSSKGPVIGSFISTLVFDLIFIWIDPSWATSLLILSACLVGVSFAVFETAQYLRMIRMTKREYRDEAATMITVLTYIGASLGLIAYSLCFNGAIPEAVDISIDLLSPSQMTQGFHTTGMLGLMLGVIGMSIAMLVSGKEDIGE